MSYNIDSTETLRSTLRISRANARKSRKLPMPESNPLTEGLVFGKDGYAPIEKFAFGGESSGNYFNDGTLAKMITLLEGEADLIFTWEGGDSHSGLRIRDGKMIEAEVVMTLAPEKTTKRKRQPC